MCASCGRQFNVHRHGFFAHDEEPKSCVMPNFIDEMEAAYITSRRQGNMQRDRQRERSTHEDRRNRYHDFHAPDAALYGRGTDPMPHTNQDELPPWKGTQPNHRGKGPKNYKRSDERIKELICQKLCDDPEIDASNIEVEVKDAHVTLTGAVDGKFEKYLAEDLVENVSGVSMIENFIRVNRG